LNIEKIQIKLFRINLEEYYKIYKSEFNNNLELDGIVAEDFSEKKMEDYHVNEYKDIELTFDLKEN
jgi:hypothetical protein